MRTFVFCERLSTVRGRQVHEKVYAFCLYDAEFERQYEWAPKGWLGYREEARKEVADRRDFVGSVAVAMTIIQHC